VQNLEYRHNPLGTVTNRADVLQSLSEAFEYDNLDRLTRARITGGAEKNYDYHEDGRIKYKSDVGTYRYGEAGAGPHAVTSVSGVRNATYRYDRNGNQLEGDGRTISYTSFDKPIEIRKGDHVSLFHYDPEHSRLFQTSNEAGAGTETIYIGGFYEKVSSPSGIQHRHYVSAGSDTIAIFLTSEQPTGPPRTRYLHQDHLGSTDTITDESGTVIERFSYDAFGKRRSGNWQDAASGAIRSTYTERAFTSHLQVDSVEIIHMGGRAYDPTLGRFASADPFIGNTGLQALNRYTYVQNNPLTATDPSGYFLRRFGDNLRDFHREYKDEIRQVAGIATAVAITALTGGGDGGFSWTALAGSMAGGAAGSAVASGGDAKTMLMGAVQGGLTYGVNQVLVPDGFATWNHVDRAAAHGLVGGLSAELQGGSFGHGVAAGAFAETLSPLLNKVPYAPLRATAEAVAGGVGSELGGGKFKNGAMSATFAYLLTPRYDNSTGASDLPLIDVLDLVGKLWSAPNTAIGLAIGGIGRLAGGEVQLENNSIEFTKSPLMDAFPGGEYGAITFGNVIIYGSYAYAAAPHERIHTFQGQFVGPAYLPLNVLGMSLSALSYPVPQLRRHDYVHGRLNFMEGSPFSDNLYGTSP
jgi:RHS repeat-associated protein